MQNFYTINKQVAVQPIERKGAVATIQSGLAVMMQSNEAVVAEAVFDALVDDEIVLKGSKIVLPGDSEARPWNQKVFTHDGKSFVLVPIAEVMMISAPEEK